MAGPTRLTFGTAATPATHMPAVQAASLPANRLAEQIKLDPSNPSAVAEIGATAQRRSAAVSDQLLAHVKVADAGDIGGLLGELAIKCKSVDVRVLQPNWRDSLRKLPLVGGLVARAQSGIEGQMNTARELEVISGKLSAARETLLRDAKDLDALFDQNESIHAELAGWIEAGRVKLAELDGQIAKSDPAADPQAHRDLVALRERLDRHLHDLELTATIRLQNAPKIRIVQSGNLNLAEKLQSSVLNTVPLWKENLALAITQVRQAEAVALQERVDQTTNDLLRASADMLHQNSVAIAKGNVRGVVDISTLQHTQEKLLATISDVRAITAKAAEDRAAAREQLQQMSTQLLATAQG